MAKGCKQPVLDTQNTLLQAILKNAPILISAKDIDGNVLFTSEHFRVLDGPEPKDFINKNVFELFPKKIADKLWKNDLLAQNSSQPILVEEKVHHQDGSLHTYHTAKFRLLDDNGNLLGTCAVSFDITHLKKLEYDVQHDPLTELYNRRFLDLCYTNELRRAHRDKRNLIFTLFDLDGFKMFNDNLGHVKGDELLVDFAHILTSNFKRPSDFCFRLGGDEFVVIYTTEEKHSTR